MKRLAAVILIALALSGVLPVAAQDDACLQKGGVWSADYERCVVGVEIRITVNYPLDIVEYPFAAQAVDAFLTEQRAAFFQPLLEYGLFPSPGPLVQDVDYEVFSLAPSVSSLKFTIYEYTGGAHGLTYFKTFTFDLANERVLSLDDLFASGAAPLEAIAELVRGDLRAQWGDALEEAWLEEGTLPDPVNYQNWVLTPDALIFYFPPYQVAAYALGPQTVTVPLVALEDYLDFRFAPDEG